MRVYSICPSFHVLCGSWLGLSMGEQIAFQYTEHGFSKYQLHDHPIMYSLTLYVSVRLSDNIINIVISNFIYLW